MPQPQADRVPLATLLSSGSAFSSVASTRCWGGKGLSQHVPCCGCARTWLPHPHSRRPAHAWFVAPIPLQMLGNLVFLCAPSHQNEAWEGLSEAEGLRAASRGLASVPDALASDMLSIRWLRSCRLSSELSCLLLLKEGPSTYLRKTTFF